MLKAYRLLSHYLSVFIAFVLVFTIPITPAQAIAPACAVCVVAIGSGLGISRALGIDDLMTGVWVGALLLAIAMFTGSWIKKKWPNFAYYNLVSYGLTYFLTIPFFFIFKLFDAGGSIFGVSKLLLGMIAGTIALIIGLYTDTCLRRLQENHKAFFPFQKVILPLIALSLATLAMWLLL